jgi:aminobenzoyl-glutamate utilization protein B
MTDKTRSAALLIGCISLLTVGTCSAADAVDYADSLDQLKQEVAGGIDRRAKLVQEMVDSLFSFAEPGFQEFRSSEYITAILERHGFVVERGVSGIPTAWTAKWGTGGPLIALGSDIDALLGLSQLPGVAHIQPQLSGAPGHGEGHNSGMPAVVAAAIATQEVMIRHGISGRLMIWPGIAEELLGTKAFFVRDGVFKGVDATIFTHVSRDLSTSWGSTGNTGLVSVQYTFSGRTAHSAGSPWLGRSALDAVELMNIGWNYRREHLPLTQRSHYVITQGGGQPNVVPDVASVWYYFREQTFESIRNLYEIGNTVAEAAAMMTDTTVTRDLLGYAAPNHGNKPLAEAAHKNMKRIGMPRWSEADQAFARAVQVTNPVRDFRRPRISAQELATEIAPLSTPETRGASQGGGSDDIGDIMWSLPTITIRFPANIPNTVNHHVTAAMAMATPIAHKGTVAGAKAVAMTVLDLVTTPELIASAWDYFKNIQTKDIQYMPVLSQTDKPAIHLNRHLMEQIRPQMERLYYDPKKYDSYLEQLGIPYPPSQTADKIDPTHRSPTP